MCDRAPKGPSRPLEVSLSFAPDLWNNPGPAPRPRTLLVVCSELAAHAPPFRQARLSHGVVLRRPGLRIAPFWLASPEEAAEIENAWQEGEITDLVLCGHAHCTHLDAIADEPPRPREAAASAPSPFGRILGAVAAGNRRAAQARENVLLQLRNIASYPSVARGLAQGRLRLHGWLYQDASGIVTVHDPSRRVFVPLVGEEERIEVTSAFDRCPSM